MSSTLQGINLAGANYYNTERPYVDMIRMAGPAGSGIADPVTGLPSAATGVQRQIPYDPGEVRNLVATWDANVTQIQVTSQKNFTLDLTKNRGTLTTTVRPDVNLPLTIKSSGPVKKFSVVRAEHEAGFLKGDIFNPDFIASLQGLSILRPLDWNSTNSASYPAQRPLPSDFFYTKDKGSFPAEHIAQVAAKIGAKLWFPINHTMPDAQILEIMHAIYSILGNTEVDFEWSNEFGWNYQKTFAVDQTKLQGYGTDWRKYYGYRAGKLALLAAQVCSKYKVNLSDQMSMNSDKNIASMLAGWKDSKAPTSLIAGYAIAPYINCNAKDSAKNDVFPQLLAIQQANDVEGFYKFLDARRMDKQPYFASIAAKACKPNNIPFKIYEHNFSIYSQAPVITDATIRNNFVNWVAPLVHSKRAAEIAIANLQSGMDAGVTEACFFQLSTKDAASGLWAATPHVSAEEPYPVLTAIKALNMPTPHNTMGNKPILTAR